MLVQMPGIWTGSYPLLYNAFLAKGYRRGAMPFDTPYHTGQTVKYGEYLYRKLYMGGRSKRNADLGKTEKKDRLESQQSSAPLSTNILNLSFGSWKRYASP